MPYNYPPCKKCGKPATYRVRYARIWLCPKHFIEFFERRVKRTIDDYKLVKNVKRILVAVSGGKDSVTALYILNKFKDVYGYEVIGVTIDLGIPVYSTKSVEIAKSLYKMLGIEYHIIRLSDYGFTIRDLQLWRKEKRIRRPICSFCGIIKRYLLNKAALDLEANVVATGHNLDDLVKFVATNYYNGRINDLVKLGLKTPPIRGKFAGRIRPLGLMSDREILYYVNNLGLPYVHMKCPYSPKHANIQDRILVRINDLEEEYPGFKIGFIKSFLHHLKPIIMKGYNFEEKEIYTCSLCGMPTSNKDRICSFCKLRLKVSKAISA